MQSYRVLTECTQADDPVKSSVFAAACGSRWPTLPKVLLGHRPAVHSPSTPDDLRGRCGRSVARSGHSGPDSGSQSQALVDLLTARAVVMRPGIGPVAAGRMSSALASPGSYPSYWMW